MLKVLFITRDFPFAGGISQAILSFNRYRNKELIVVEVVTLAPPDSLMRQHAADIQVHTLGDNGYSRPALKLRALLQRVKPDVVVCNSFKTFLMYKLATVGARCIFWVHGLGQIMQGQCRQRMFRVLAKDDTLLFVSEAAGRIHSYSGHRGRSLTIAHGVASEPKPPTSSRRAELAIPADAFVIGYTAEFTHCKQHAVLLQAFGLLAKKYSNLRLVLIGSGQMYDELRGSVARYCPAESVHFLGTRSDARQLLGSMDLYAHVCEGEAFGLALVEAMLAGLPTVVSAAGALPEIVHDGVTGLLFRTNDPADLAAKIELYLIDAQLRVRLAAAGKQFCLNNYSMEEFVNRFTSLLQQEAVDRGSTT